MDRFARQFGARVKRARTERGLTQAQLAKLALVGANYVPRIERGEMTPSVDAAFRLAQALGVSVDDLCSSRAGPPAPLQQAAFAVLALNDDHIAGFRRSLTAIETLRALLRGERPPDGDGYGGEAHLDGRGAKRQGKRVVLGGVAARARRKPSKAPSRGRT